MTTILYIEDNPDNTTLVDRVIESLGFQFLWAQTGQEGLAMFEAHLPDMVLLDINLPDLDGYEIARRLRKHPTHAKVPIVAVTANALAGDSLKAIEAGCDAYLPKPLKIGDLRKQILVFIPA